LRYVCTTFLLDAPKGALRPQMTMTIINYCQLLERTTSADAATEARLEIQYTTQVKPDWTRKERETEEREKFFALGFCEYHHWENEVSNRKEDEQDR